jgi:hypothetical protein
MKRLLLFFQFLATGTFAQEVDGEIELAGVVIGQYKTAVHAQYGPPIERDKNNDGWIYEFHALKPDTSVYALFKYSSADTTKVYGIQINGRRYDEMHPFKGLKLGATAEQVTQVLGPFDRTEKVEDPPVTIQYYPKKNYSVEITPGGHLYGIQIFGNILDNQPLGTPTISHFKNAVLTKNIDSLVYWISPDVEVYKGGKTLMYSYGARDEFSKGQSELAQAIVGETGSVHYAFAKEFAQGTSESRMHPELNKVTSVDKFYDSTVISEIVFHSHAGKWKVYEIKFR